MSLIEIGISKGFIEKKEDCLIIYGKRIISADMLNNILNEARQAYIVPDVLIYNLPIVCKKKDKIDMTEVLIKLFSLTLRYGIELTVHTIVHEEGGNIILKFKYKNREICKMFDVDMLCNMEKDYVLGWFEETLQKIDAEMQEKENEQSRT